jgi:hypothetical protein
MEHRFTKERRDMPNSLVITIWILGTYQIFSLNWLDFNGSNAGE